jgi:four helix bundle protein
MKDLRIRTKEFALRVIRLYSSLPTSTEAQVIGKQLLRSGTSVGAHYREGIRARSNAEFISKLEGGMQELEESSYWLELLVEAHIFTPEKLMPLMAEADELMVFETDWLPGDTERAELPVALDLAGLYEQMLRRLLPLPPRAGETLKAQVERLGLLRSKQNECRKMEARLQKEQQFNRKVELNAQLRVLQAALEKLKSVE